MRETHKKIKIAEDNLKHGYYEEAIEMVNKSKEFLKYLKNLEVDKKTGVWL